MGIVRLNHAVLYVSDASVSARFYADTLDFEVVGAIGDAAIFLRAPDSDNDHDLGLFHVGLSAAPSAADRCHLAPASITSHCRYGRSKNSPQHATDCGWQVRWSVRATTA